MQAILRSVCMYVQTAIVPCQENIERKAIMVAMPKTDFIDLVDPRKYHGATKLLRAFFEQRGYIEVPAQHRFSILAACEDPNTIATLGYAGQLWPLPQTSQMWLEYELLNDPDAPGFFSSSYSFRNEPKPIPGRHNRAFPMFEFETRGDINVLRQLIHDLLDHLGFGDGNPYPSVDYAEAAKNYNAPKGMLHGEHESRLHADYGHAVLLESFPEYTSPFWNMRLDGDVARKIDGILYGIETIGSAERSSDPDEMRRQFHTISGGDYAMRLFAEFTEERVEKELEDFLSLPFIERCGGGIGMNRLIRALDMHQAQQHAGAKVLVS